MTLVNIPGELSSIDLESMSENDLREFILTQNKRLQELAAQLTQAQTALAVLNVKNIREQLLLKRVTKDDNVWGGVEVTVIPTKEKKQRAETPQERADRLMGF